MAIVLSGDTVLRDMSTKSSITVNTSADSSDWWTTPLQHGGPGGDPWHPILWRSLAYGDIYSQHLWVSIAVDKLVQLATAPELNVYRSRPRGRQEANETAYGLLVRHPNARHDPVEWWTWFFSIFMIYGSAVAWKQRGPDGRPVQLHGLHPSRLRYGGPWGGWTYGWEELGLTGDPKDHRWWWKRNDGTEIPLNRQDLLVVHNFSPNSLEEGLSKLEPLRWTLENEAAARRANRSMWENGGKPSFVLKHPGKFSNSPKSVQALADQFKRKHGGVENWGAPLVLEEGMDALPLQVHNDLAYIDTRQLNAREVVAAYDLPAVAVGLLDSGTPADARELHKSVYRDTMPPIFRTFQAALDHDLRDGTFGADREPDFPSSLSAVWSLDEFLRATPEERIKSNAQAIQTGQKSIAEVREEDNLPFVEGTDVLLVNAAITPLETVLDTANQGVDVNHLALIIDKLTSAVGSSIITIDEARDLLRAAGGRITPRTPNELKPGLGGITPGAPPPNSGASTNTGLPNSTQPGLVSPPDTSPTATPALPAGRQKDARALWSKLGRISELADVDMAELAALSPPELRAKVLGAYLLVRDDEGTVSEYRDLLRRLLN